MIEKMTPAMRQFYAMKEKHPDCIIFFRMGDFYETFGDDAGVVSRELDIVLTARGKDREGEKMPLAGVPYHAAETYISRLVSKGYRVAVCEQIEDPKKAKGIVKRDVVRVITPGTVIDASMIASPGARYLMALWPDDGGKRFGLAFLDISTGEFFVEECAGDRDFSGVLSEVERYRPQECVVGPALPDGLEGRLGDLEVLVTRYRGTPFLRTPLGTFSSVTSGRSLLTATAAPASMPPSGRRAPHSPMPPRPSTPPSPTSPGFRSGRRPTG